jgi:tRNA uridine 5-carbamoylmethylation protein Kti12
VTDMVAEKNLRGVLRSQVDRSLSKDSIIIVDSLNNIKVLALFLYFIHPYKHKHA